MLLDKEGAKITLVCWCVVQNRSTFLIWILRVGVSDWSPMSMVLALNFILPTSQICTFHSNIRINTFDVALDSDVTLYCWCVYANLPRIADEFPEHGPPMWFSLFGCYTFTVSFYAIWVEIFHPIGWSMKTFCLWSDTRAMVPNCVSCTISCSMVLWAPNWNVVGRIWTYYYLSGSRYWYTQILRYETIVFPLVFYNRWYVFDIIWSWIMMWGISV